MTHKILYSQEPPAPRHSIVSILTTLAVLTLSFAVIPTQAQLSTYGVMVGTLVHEANTDINTTKNPHLEPQQNHDTCLYFGNPIYTYSLRQGIDDGLLAPYRVHHRIISEWDAAGWRPSKD